MDIPFVFILWKNTNELGGICQTVRGMSVESKQKERLSIGHGQPEVLRKLPSRLCKLTKAIKGT